jgi:hypothetical protein
MAKKYYQIKYKFTDFLLCQELTRVGIFEGKDPRSVWIDFVNEMYPNAYINQNNEFKDTNSLPSLIDIRRIE